MGLADVVATDSDANPMHGLPCSVGAALTTLTGEDLDALLKLLYGPTKEPGGRGKSAAQVFHLVMAAAAREAAKGEDMDPVAHAAYAGVKYQTINRHRGGTCRCSR